MGRVDHHLVAVPATFGQFNEDAPEDAHPAPAEEAVVNCLVCPVTYRDIAPAKTVADHKDNPADHPAIINTRHPMRQRKERRNPRHLVVGCRVDVNSESQQTCKINSWYLTLIVPA